MASKFVFSFLLIFSVSFVVVCLTVGVGREKHEFVMNLFSSLVNVSFWGLLASSIWCIWS